MKKNDAQSGLFYSRILLAFTLCSAGVLLAMLSFAANPPSEMRVSSGNSLGGDSLFGDKHPGLFTGNAAAAKASAPLTPTGPGWSLVTSANTSATQTNYLNG